MRRARYLLLLASGFLIGIVFGTVIYPLMQKYKSPPLGDYGDAPDGFNAGYMPPFYRVVGRFPTKYKTENSRVGNSGAYVANPGVAMLGVKVSSERGALDPKDPDGRHNMVDDDLYDDGLYPGQIPPLSVNITLSQGAEITKWYLNVLVDSNHDGQWSNEWYVRNLEVNLSPGSTIQVPLEIPIPFPSSWMRIALTNEPINESAFLAVGGWDGSGSFEYGEIEDYLYGFYEVAAADGNFSFSMAEIPLTIAEASADDASGALATAAAALDAISQTLSQAQELASALENLQEEVVSRAESIFSAIEDLRVQATDILSVAGLIECETIRANVEAQIKAVLSVLAYLEIEVETAVNSTSIALSQAKGASEALSNVFEEAHSKATTVSVVTARASLRSEAAKRAWEIAIANALTYSKVAGEHYFTVSYANADAFSEAFTKSWTAATTAAKAAISAQSFAMDVLDLLMKAQDYAQSAAEAASQVEASVEAIASAELIIESLSGEIASANELVQMALSGKCCSGH